MLKLISPAKINPFLRIIKKREDGFHELASLFQAVDLVDILTFQAAPADLFTCSNPKLPVDANNLVVKAVNLFRIRSGKTFPLHIHLEKHIPVEAGLGGGSSNAATTLYALNQLSGMPFSDSELATMGAELGSDVSFFFSSGIAYCTGRGEIVEDVDLPLTSYTLCKPSFGSSTPAVYKSLKLNSCSTADPIALLNSFQNNIPQYINDLEPAAFAVYPALEAFKLTLLASGFETVLMSGSGSTFICKGLEKAAVPHGFFKKVNGLTRNIDSWYSIRD